MSKPKELRITAGGNLIVVLTTTPGSPGPSIASKVSDVQTRDALALAVTLLADIVSPAKDLTVEVIDAETMAAAQAANVAEQAGEN